MKNLIILFFFVFTTQAFARTHKESYYQEIASDIFGGKSETMPDGKRCDIITDYHAIEIDFAPKFTEAIGQSLDYAYLTNKKPGILLVITNGNDLKHWDRLNLILAKYQLDRRIDTKYSRLLDIFDAPAPVSISK